MGCSSIWQGLDVRARVLLQSVLHAAAASPWLSPRSLRLLLLCTITGMLLVLLRHSVLHRGSQDLMLEELRDRLATLEGRVATVVEESETTMRWLSPRLTRRHLAVAQRQAKRFTTEQHLSPLPPAATVPHRMPRPHPFPERGSLATPKPSLLQREGAMPHPEDVLARCRELSQRSLRLGMLARPTWANGALVMDDSCAVEPLHIWYRLSPRSHKSGTNRRLMVPVPIISFLSLTNSLKRLSPAQRAATAIHVLFNGFANSATWADWLRSVIGNTSAVVDIDPNCPPGNSRSFLYMVDRIFEVRDPRAVMFLVEDDYICHPEMLAEVTQLFASHDVCMAVPYDYMDRYIADDNVDDGRIKVIAGAHRHWRTVESSTVTYATRLEVMNAVKDILPAPWDDRKRCYRMRGRGVEIWGPLPGMATHLNHGIMLESYQGPYFDYFRFARELLNQSRLLPPPIPGWEAVLETVL
eukprot:GGOE01020745.1.p1 GENE.GGOE01020745.1~~GGOE01020745.1.p1  ORF type:complete len:469 (+),score=120.59 GGOE01020745.1:79-1485(+)